METGMRDNGPITTREVDITDGEPLVSRTDTGGRIVFVNRAFISISGYTEDELMGSPHNIVRHPHMPKQAFANLWASIKARRPWEGLIKNRTKEGDFYWVRANVTPVVEDGKVAGYIPIRSKPNREHVAEAERAYTELRTEHGKHLELRDGEIVPRGLWPWVIETANSISGRLGAAAVVAALAILCVGWLGFAGMASSNHALGDVYEHDLVAVNQLRGIPDLIRDNRNLLAQLTISLGQGAKPDSVLSAREPPIRANLARIDHLWHAWQGSMVKPEQRDVASRFEPSYAALANDGIQQALALAHRGEVAQADALFQTKAPALFQGAFDANRALVEQQVQLGQVEYAGAVEELTLRLMWGIGLGVVGVMMVLVMSWLLLRTIRSSLREVEAHFDAIARNDTNWVIKAARAREFYPATTLLRAIRARLSFAHYEQYEMQRKAADARREASSEMASRIEREAGAAVEQVATRTDAMATEAEAMAGSAERVSANASYVAEAAGQAMTNAQVVAAASEQLAASIREVSSQVEHASSVARQAEQKDSQATATVGSPSDAAARIGAVVRLIADIAGRTNLLALNATIEAARAGRRAKALRSLLARGRRLPPRPPKRRRRSHSRSPPYRAPPRRRWARSVRSAGRSVRSPAYPSPSRPRSMSRPRRRRRSPATSRRVAPRCRR
jgi:PAS domain S-box-containing protein